MKKTSKLIALAMIIVVFTLFFSSISLAKIEKVGDITITDDGVIEKVESITKYELPKKNRKDSTINIDIIKEAVKKYDKEAPLNESELNRYVSKKIEEAKKINQAEKINTSYSVQPLSLSFPWIKIYYEWIYGPYKTSRVLYTASTVAWSAYDNYRSTIPIKVTEEKEKTINYTLGFTGSSEFLDIGFSASYGASYTSRFTIGTTVPAWTVWYHRPYVKYYKDTYVGVVKNYYIHVFTGEIAIKEVGVSGQDRVLYVDGTQFESFTNTAHNPSASTPNPPSTLP